jgi:hypothetical protein
MQGKPLKHPITRILTASSSPDIFTTSIVFTITRTPDPTPRVTPILTVHLDGTSSLICSVPLKWLHNSRRYNDNGTLPLTTHAPRQSCSPALPLLPLFSPDFFLSSVTVLRLICFLSCSWWSVRANVCAFNDLLTTSSMNV